MCWFRVSGPARHRDLLAIIQRGSGDWEADGRHHAGEGDGLGQGDDSVAPYFLGVGDSMKSGHGVGGAMLTNEDKKVSRGIRSCARFGSQHVVGGQQRAPAPQLIASCSVHDAHLHQ